MRQNLWKTKSKCPIELPGSPAMGQNQRNSKQKWLIERLYETKLVEKQVKMSHRIARTSLYGLPCTTKLSFCTIPKNFPLSRIHFPAGNLYA
jgi:hypothetical protein